MAKNSTHNVLVTLGFGPAENRSENDLYTTSQVAVRQFLQTLKKDGVSLKNPVLEPSAGLGDISTVLIEFGYDVRSFDLVNRQDWERYNKNVQMGQRDFLNHDYADIKPGTIITNPPFTYSEEFAKRGLMLLEEGGLLMLFCRLQFLEGKSRHVLYKNHPPKYIYVYSYRALCYPNGVIRGDESSPQSYAWFCWEKGWRGDSVIRWIGWQDESDEPELF